MKNKISRVVVAMSGGVDSSVAAHMIHQKGYDAVGVSMQLWDHSVHKQENFGRCCSLDDFQDARLVADSVGIPFYIVDFEADFYETVVQDFIDEYVAGKTPSPCVLCNGKMKFHHLLERMVAMDASHVATGHFARVDYRDGLYHLYKGKDDNKDQSYFLFSLTQEQLSHCLFPLGELTKPQIRDMARELKLVTAEKQESQEVCFVTQKSYGQFLEEQLPSLSQQTGKGNIRHINGQVIGQHIGYYRYTVGQRKGLGIGWHEPLFVLKVDPIKNEVIVGEIDYLEQKNAELELVNWIIPIELPYHCEVKIRYRSKPVGVTVEQHPTKEDRLKLLFDEPQNGVAVGQAAVFYLGDEVLGGGWLINDDVKPKKA